MNPIIPKTNAAPGAGAPASLYLGEIASNRSTGKLYLGCDSGVVEVGGGGTAGSQISTFIGDGTTTEFSPLTGYSDTTVGNYLVSVGGIDQRPTTDWTISATNSGTITFASAPPAGAAIVVRAFTGASGGGGGSGDAISLQGRALADTAPTDGQAIVWDEAGATWKPGNAIAPTGGTITFNTVGVHYFAVPASARWARLQATAGDGSDGTDGQPGSTGTGVPEDNPQAAESGADGIDGQDGKSIKVANSIIAIGGAKGLKGFGGGGGGNYSSGLIPWAGSGLAGNGPNPGLGGNGWAGQGGQALPGLGGWIGGDGVGSIGGAGENLSGGNGGNGATSSESAAGGGGGGGLRSGGGGGGGNYYGLNGGTGGAGGKGTMGQNGESKDIPYNLTPYAGGNLAIEITNGAGSASITFTW